MIVYLVCYAASLLLRLAAIIFYPAQGFWRRRRICMRQTISGSGNLLHLRGIFALSFVGGQGLACMSLVI